MLELHLYIFRNQFCDFESIHHCHIFLYFETNAVLIRKKGKKKKEQKNKRNKIESKNGKYSFFQKAHKILSFYFIKEL